MEHTRIDLTAADLRGQPGDIDPENVQNIRWDSFRGPTMRFWEVSELVYVSPELKIIVMKDRFGRIAEAWGEDRIKIENGKLVIHESPNRT